MIARDFIKRYNYSIPMLIDSMDNRADDLYAGWPERIYIITEDGRIAYKGAMGPFGFKPEELNSWLEARK